MLNRTNEKNIRIPNLNFTLKNFSKSFLIDSRNSRFLAVAAARLGGKRASEKIP